MVCDDADNENDVGGRDKDDESDRCCVGDGDHGNEAKKDSGNDNGTVRTAVVEDDDDEEDGADDDDVRFVTLLAAIVNDASDAIVCRCCE